MQSFRGWAGAPRPARKYLETETCVTTTPDVIAPPSSESMKIRPFSKTARHLYTRSGLGEFRQSEILALDSDNLIRKADPFTIPRLSTIIQESFDTDTVGIPVATVSFNNMVGSKDPFSSLSLELLLEILLILPSKDVCNLKLASPVFASLTLPECFWTSRFQRGLEFYSIFEARNARFRRCGWKSTYLKVKELKYTMAFKNRRRVWNILTQIKGTMVSFSTSQRQGRPSPMLLGPDELDNFSAGTFTHTEINYDRYFFWGGSRMLWYRNVHLTGQIANIYVSFVNWNGIKYISGIPFQQCSGGNTSLGYIIPGSEFPLPGDFGDRKGTINGLYLAADPKGYRAISFIPKAAQDKIRWLGNHKEYTSNASGDKTFGPTNARCWL
ncbi:hypothetical protein AJ80_02274 [Polytolypa hystricis UAMH7299]|uniref:DUF7600 domain-containing protein n=1 Tax=Polytolypa hystricis (strain UAMH7299) TaxID=1447883 RepID=A0A2B7YS06_POLH7|nr:hypothetical protein AJ80_02274 [Polytolypa hystricis UAMH7299]